MKQKEMETMTVHITRDELIRYFEIVFSENPTEDDSEFAEEIDAHVAECDECFSKMQMMRIMLQGFSSSQRRRMTLSTSTAVLPEPAAALTSIVPFLPVIALS